MLHLVGFLSYRRDKNHFEEMCASLQQTFPLSKNMRSVKHMVA
jgi:hypothetical protein